MAKRQRYVYPTGEVPHKWAHQTQASARNPQGNLFFEGPTLYSYRTSYPIAHLSKKRDGNVLALHRSDKYSATTAQHCYAAQRATNHLHSVEVPSVLPHAKDDHAANIAYLTDMAAACLARAQRAMTAWRVQNARDSARTALQRAALYSKHFGIRRKLPAFPQLEWNAAIERAERIENPDPVRDARKIKQRAARQAAAKAALQGLFDDYSARVATYNEAQRAAHAAMPDAAVYWREHGEWPEAPASEVQYPYLGYQNERKLRKAGFDVPRVDYYGRFSKVLLRVAGDDIVTSMGARVPLAAAPMVWAMVQRHLGRGWSAKSDGLVRRTIGDYPLDRIDADGTLHAGCHTIPYAELQLMAQRLGLT